MSNGNQAWGSNVMVTSGAMSAPPGPGAWRGSGYMTTLFGIIMGILGFVLLVKLLQHVFWKHRGGADQDASQATDQEGEGEGRQSQLAQSQVPQTQNKGFALEDIGLLGDTIQVQGNPKNGDDLEKGEEGEGECVICLGEFVQGQLLRKLHVCQHSFHQECVDAWLGMHKECPLCRTPLKAKSPEETMLEENSNAAGITPNNQSIER